MLQCFTALFCHTVLAPNLTGGSVFIHTVVFWLFGLGMMALGPALSKWKLQPDRHPSRQQYQVSQGGSQSLLILVSSWPWQVAVQKLFQTGRSGQIGLSRRLRHQSI